MVTVHKPRLLYDAIRTRLASQTSKPVGEGKRPATASTPYYVVRPFPDRASFGSQTDPNQIRLQTFLVFYVGNTMDAAQELQEDAQAALLGWAPTVAGCNPAPIELDLGDVRNGPDFDGPTYEIADRYLITVS